MTNEEIKIYTAGVLDTCGKITLRKDGKSKNSIFPYIEIRSDKDINLKLIQSYLGGTIRKNGNKYILYWTHKKALYLVEQIFDYLLVRKEEAEIVKQLYSDRFTRHYETQRKKEIAKKFIQLHLSKYGKWKKGNCSLLNWVNEE